MGSTAAPQVIGRYQIYGKIAAGGMASVHFGRLEGAAGFSRTVAIKRLHPHLVEEPEFVATMVDEARLAARIRHPNVVPTLDVVSPEGEVLVVMEYVRGESLARLLRASAAEKRPVPLPVASAIAVGALHGLHAAHEATSDRGTPLGIVHRDVSPQNILVGTDGIARLIDFGVAKAAGRVTSTREGVVKGKLSYMAPEQLGSGDVDRRADLFAMTVVLWEMLTGKRMLSGAAEAEIIGKVMAGVSEPPSRHAPGVPADLDALVLKGLSKDREDRFASAREMADALMRIVPPAFPPDVGAWVEETAHEALAKRESILADIESRPNENKVGPGQGESPTRPDVPDALADAPTVVSQPSSLSIETPGPRVPGNQSPRRRFAGALAALALLGAGAGLLIAQRNARRAPEPAPSASQPASVAPAGSETARPLPVEVPSASAAAPTSTTSAVPAAPTSIPRGHSPPRPPHVTAPAPPPSSPAPKPSDSLVFTHPD